MKRFLSIVVLAVAVLFPLGVFAADAEGARVNFTLIHACEKPVGGKCNPVGEISIKSTGAGELTPVKFTGEFIASSKDVVIKEVKALDGWTVSKDEITGKYTFTPTNTTKAKEFKVAKVVTEYPSDLKEDCSVNFKTDSMGEIIIDVTTEVKNTETGAFLPVTLFAGALAVVGVVYAGTKKNKKLHNI